MAPWAVCMLMLVVTVMAVWFVWSQVIASQQARMGYESRRIESAVLQRMTAYVQVLRGGLGLFQSVDEVGFERWLTYVDTLQLATRYPGFKSLSFAAAIQPENLQAFVESVRRQPLPPGLHNQRLIREFTPRSPVHEASEPSIHGVLIYVAPLIPENERVLGVDMMQEPMRRQAMERAIESGNAVLSPKIQLAGQGDRKAGFIAYMAVHRQGQLKGWLTAAFLAEDFMHGLLGTEGSDALEFELYDGAQVAPEALLYSTAGISYDGTPRPLASDVRHRLVQTSQIDVCGRPWTLRYLAAPGLASLSDSLSPWLVAVGGLLATALFWVLALSGARLRVAFDQTAEHNRLLQHEITERQRAEAEVRHLATHDPLTGLANRTLFLDRLDTALERARRRQQRCALAYVDLDGFKFVNDTQGHHAGDELLRQVAGRICALLRKEDTLARLGGDEFAVILEQLHDPPGAEGVGRAIIDVLNQPFDLDLPTGKVEAQIGASIGIAVFPLHGASSDALIVTADKAMYSAKHGGKNRCVIATYPTASA